MSCFKMFFYGKRRMFILISCASIAVMILLLMMTNTSGSSDPMKRSPKLSPYRSKSDGSIIGPDSELASADPKYVNRHSGFQAKMMSRISQSASKSRAATNKYVGREPIGIILGNNFASSWDRKHQDRARLQQKEVIQNNVILDHQLSHKLVHLDLKGAPPKLSYLQVLFPYLKDMGATGLLLEYEDSFPYWGPLESISAKNSYSKEDIAQILNLAKQSNLEVIPIIQTIGHMESVLKLKEYSDLREVPTYPQVICPTNNRTLSVIKSIIDQMIELHPGLNWLHIGSDEVYNIGECMRCQAFMAANQWGKSEMFLHHVKKIAKYVKDVYDVQPIIWDDEVRKAPINTIRKSGIKEYVEIMVWKYSAGIMVELRMDLWEKYMETFSGIWIASAFKGASNPDSFITNISERLNNHKEWMELVDMYKSVVPFRGIALTGWQRFDHFSVLCELLPQAIPSLAVSLMYVTERKADHDALSKVGQALNCNSYLNLDLKYLDFVNKCEFPGSNFYEIAQRLHILKRDIDKMLQNSHVTGWVSEYNIKHNYASPQHVEQGFQDLSMMLYEVQKLKTDSEKVLGEIYDEHTVHEWLEQNLLKTLKDLTSLHKSCIRLLEMTHWPRRPLDSPHEKEL
uniref:beta-N-acetylhexosaminidase n=1 Tax=Hirondellea gigas TaxID=1518452 RepID=A0A2P2I5C7_9CRUS